MSEFALRFVVAVWFLPLFPFSGLFVHLIGRKTRATSLRTGLFVLWPLIGVTVLGHAAPLPEWLQIWVLASALLYAVRLLATRDLRLWGAYLGASGYALLWLLPPAAAAWPAALSLAIPLALLSVLVRALDERFGAAYAGLYGRLHQHQPQLAGMLTLVVLAAIATPLFPGFFVLTGIAFHNGMTAATAVLLVWVLWTWAAVVMLQGFMFGRAQTPMSPPDLAQQTLYGLAGVLVLLVLVGLALIPSLLQ